MTENSIFIKYDFEPEKNHRLSISLVPVLGVNFIPFKMRLYRDFPGEHTMVLNGLENSVAIFLAVIFVFLFAPRKKRTKNLLRAKTLVRRSGRGDRFFRWQRRFLPGYLFDLKDEDRSGGRLVGFGVDLRFSAHSIFRRFADAAPAFARACRNFSQPQSGQGFSAFP